jgi:type IV pilus assembly protein PilA
MLDEMAVWPLKRGIDHAESRVDRERDTKIKREVTHMIGKIANKMNREEKGFTLIELRVVVLIIGILIAIALPTFLGARKRAQDRGAQSNLRNGVAAAKTFFTDKSSYLGFDNLAGTAVEPSLKWVVAADPAGTVNNVDIGVATKTDLTLIAVSDSGQYFCLKDNTSTGTTFGQATSYAAIILACAGGW